MKQRRFLTGVLLLSLLLPISAERADRLSVIKTAYFDFIFPAASAESAAYLAAHADALADDICRQLDTSMKGRLPVYLNPDIQTVNAYFSPYPANHIVLYDISPTDGSLGGNSDSLLKIFAHELTHAVSLNIRTPFGQFLSDIFGDPLSVNLLLTMPMSFLEGVTVSFESQDGEGRMNDPLTRHFFMQDKIEGKFQSWKDTAGARDIYPGRESAYLYGGAFSTWLQKNYGMEKYAELWHRGSRFNPFTGYLQIRFAQVYGLRLADAWAAFADSIAVPSDIQNNASFVPGTGDGIYSCLASGADGIAWFDRNRSGVFFRKHDGTVTKLFDADASLNRLSFSSDGKLLLVSDARFSGAGIAARVRIFSIEGERFLAQSWTGLRDASFAGSSSLVCAVMVNSQQSDLILFELTRPDEQRILLTAGTGREFHAIYNPVFAGAGQIACLAANGLDRRIFLIDTVTGTVRKIGIDAAVQAIRFLESSVSSKGTVLSFSWAGKDGLYRGALYYPETGSLFLQSPDFSGGVFYPVVESATGQVVYVASFSGADRLMSLGGSDFNLPVQPPLIDYWPATALTVAAEPPSTGTVEVLSAERPYNPLPWMLQGLFLPFPSVMPIDTGLGKIAPGFLYIASDPTEKYSLTVNPSVSVDPFFLDYSAQVTDKIDGSALSLTVADRLQPAINLFDPYRDLAVTLSLKQTRAMGSSWKGLTLDLSGIAHWFAPDIDGIGSPYSASFNASSLAASVEIEYSAVRTLKLPNFALCSAYQTGFLASAGGYYGVLLPDDEATPVLQALTSVYTPVIPLSVTLSGAASDGLSFSPVAVYAESKTERNFSAGLIRYVPAFPEYDNTGYEYLISNRVLGVSAEFTPFHLEIQKGLPVLPLYANRMVYIAGYRGALFDQQASSPVYIDSVYTRLSLQASALVGIATNVLISGNAEYAYPLRAGTGRLLLSLTYQVVY